MAHQTATVAANTELETTTRRPIITKLCCLFNLLCLVILQAKPLDASDVAAVGILAQTAFNLNVWRTAGKPMSLGHAGLMEPPRLRAVMSISYAALWLCCHSL